MATSSEFGFNEGEALYRLASTYPTLRDVVLEIVQNALDMNATKVTLTINQRSRNVVARDDGEGATQARFEEALNSVGKGIKTDDKMGRFGIGLVSPFGKCARFFFTSTPRSNSRAYLEWTFVTDEIRPKKKIGGIPMRPRPDLQFARGEQRTVKNVSLVSWRTEVRLENYTKDAQISRITFESLRDAVLDRFSAVMRRNNAIIIVTIVNEDGEKSTQEIRAKDFGGRKLAEAESVDPKSGRTLVRLYLTRATEKGRKGKVLIGESRSDYRMDFSTFARNLPDVCELSDDVLSALNSGFFEGEITNTSVSLLANRKGFELNDALIGFCVAIDEWYEKTGKEHFENEKELKQSERYQQLGIRSLRVIEEIIKRPEFASLLAYVDTFKRGSIGRGHVEIKGNPETVKAVSTQMVKSDPTAEPGSRKGEEKVAPEKENPSHTPFTVVGPQGIRRVSVRSNSLGIQLVHEAMPGSDHLWVIDETTGTLSINVLHPYWLQCEDHSDKTLMRFQEYVMLQALSLKSSNPDWQPPARLVLDRLMEPYVYMLIHGDSLSGRSAKKKLVVDSPSKPTLVKKA